MSEQNEQIKYKDDVIGEIIKENNGNNMKKYYHYFPHNIGRSYCFDLVELSDSDNRHDNCIYKIYEICSYDDFCYKQESLFIKLRNYWDITHANVFLAYMDDEHHLCIISFEGLCEKAQSKAKSFIDFNIKLEKTLMHFQEVSFEFMFRGQSNNRFEAMPSIFRNKYILYDDKLYHEAIRRLPNEFTKDMSAFDNLVKMQHYNLPTRLLDITSNPLVALYFACNQDFDKDGVVYIYRVPVYSIKYYDSIFISFLANLAKQPLSFNCSSEYIDRLINEIDAEHPFQDFLHGLDPNKEVLHNVFCVKPKLNNERIIRQNGAFFLYGMGKYKTEPASLSELPYSIDIDANSKKNILRKLNQMGINEAALFPETDKVLKQIKDEYNSYRGRGYRDVDMVYDNLASDEFLYQKHPELFGKFQETTSQSTNN